MTARRGLVAMLLLIGLSGCTITANLNTGYETTTAAVASSRRHGRLAVRRFTDSRPPRLYTTLGRVFLTYVPLIPYVAMPYERVDESARKAGEEGFMAMPPYEEYTYPASMAKAIGDDLAASSNFEAVDYIDEGSDEGYRYVLSGELHESPLEKDVTSYGLGILGVYLWILPIPAGQVWARVDLDLALTDTRTGEKIWERRLTHEYAKWVTLYTASPSLVYGGVTTFDITQLPSSARVDRESLFSWHFEVLRQAMEGVPKEIVTVLDGRT